MVGHTIAVHDGRRACCRSYVTENMVVTGWVVAGPPHIPLGHVSKKPKRSGRSAKPWEGSIVQAAPSTSVAARRRSAHCDMVRRQARFGSVTLLKFMPQGCGQGHRQSSLRRRGQCEENFGMNTKYVDQNHHHCGPHDEARRSASRVGRFSGSKASRTSTLCCRGKKSGPLMGRKKFIQIWLRLKINKGLVGPLVR